MVSTVDGDGSERTVLEGFLDRQREIVRYKVEGLGEEDARKQLVRSPLTTCAGIVRHLSHVERSWFQKVLLGRDLTPTEPAGEQDADFRLQDDDSLASLLEGYDRECERSRASAAQLSLDHMAEGGRAVSLRWVLTHMIEETARHVGQLDILREQLDGRTGYRPGDD